MSGVLRIFLSVIVMILFSVTIAFVASMGLTTVYALAILFGLTAIATITLVKLENR